MNSIPVEQNTDRQQERLAAQRQLYSKAKVVLGWQLLVVGPVAVVIAVAVQAFPKLRSYAALWGVIVALCDVAWLTPWQRSLRNAAARIQELFDCDVLSLPWDALKVGKRPDPELVQEQARAYQRRSLSMPTLRDWYSPEVGSLPLHLGRLACQRSNCWWDAKQRRRYAAIVVLAVAVICIVVLFLALRGGFTVEDFVLKVAAPLSPVLLLGYRQFTEQMEAARRVDRLREHAEAAWSDALDGEPPDDVARTSRRLQDEIFEHRQKSPLVFDAVFRRLRDKYEVQMNYGVTELATEAKRRLRSDGD